MLKWIHVAVVGAVLAVPALGIAQSHSGDDDHPHGPSPESLAACKGKNDSDACAFEGHHGHVAGACHKSRSGDLACMGPHHHAPDAGAP